jgi:hypothetical protein
MPWLSYFFYLHNGETTLPTGRTRRGSAGMCRLTGAGALAGEHIEREMWLTYAAAGMLGKSKTLFVPPTCIQPSL